MMRALVFLLVLLVGAAAPAAEVTEQAKRLLEQGNAEDAFVLLDKNLNAATDAEVDYLYGIAALDTGRAGIAVFAFERVLAAEPNHIFARAELGRALFLIGEHRDALIEFQKVRELGAPPEITAKLDAYEAALSEASRPGFEIAGYVEGMVGFDSNFNSATSDGQVAIPAFGNIVFTLDELFQEDESLAAGARGGTYLAAPISDRFTLIAGLEAEGADYPDAERGFFYVNLRGNTGVQYRLDENDTFTAAATGFSTWVTDLNYLWSIGSIGSWRHEFNQRDAFSVFFRYSRLNYDMDIEFRDVDQYLSGLTFTHNHNSRLSVGAGIFGGVESEIDDLRDDVGRILYGIRGFGSYAITDRLIARFSVRGQFSDYRGTDGLFLRKRDDNLARIVTALDYAITKNWSVRPEIRYTNNSSNIPTSDYQRVETLLFVRYTFN